MRGRNAPAALLTCLLLLLALVPMQTAHAVTPVPRQGTYYLALGDSLSAGYQPAHGISWTHGWVYQFHAMLAKQAPIELLNLALGGECTDTFVKGGLSRACPTKTIDSPSQLAEAVALLKTRAGTVNPITVEVGGDNLYSNMQAFLKATPEQQQSMLNKILPPMGRDWVTIFRTLRHACPTCTIIAVNQYNPFPGDSVAAGDAAQAMIAYDALLNEAAAPYGVRVADVYYPFVGHELAYTWIARNDIHATTAGYTVMAEVVARTSGLIH